jgi:hypothetical protein
VAKYNWKNKRNNYKFTWVQNGDNTITINDTGTYEFVYSSPGTWITTTQAADFTLSPEDIVRPHNDGITADVTHIPYFSTTTVDSIYSLSTINGDGTLTANAPVRISATVTTG